jgi:hypothetical protein
MANKAEIKKAILLVAGNPDSGVIFRLADQFAEAIVGLDAKVPSKSDARDSDTDGLVQDGTSFERPAKETRTTKPEEKR